jgi:hypothetical protein
MQGITKRFKAARNRAVVLLYGMELANSASFQVLLLGIQAVEGPEPKEPY